MESQKFTEGEFYQGCFDSRAYNDMFYSSPQGHSDEQNFLTFVLQSLSKTFSSGKYRGRTLIDVGSGPTIHSVISASKYFDEFVLSDYTDRNRKEIEKWLKAEEGCFNWKPVIQYVCELEGRSPSEVESELRQRVKRVLKCDVRLENPFHPLNLEPADCVITSLCLEGACKDTETYSRALRSLRALLRPDGALVMVGVLGETFYTVAGQKFSCLSLTQSNIEDLLKNLGFTVQEFNVFQPQDLKDNTVSDFEAVFHLIALKSVN
ncbi:nicotinamide N-methyltransferase [Chanos chanos]|uniref:Nicotinamide N-methyltransferase n=1 Tax=Chanos chanos TaxID=29144 RepID=A0A6J2VV80_CHACN|nr:nicotinamide N-methyltransferase-like [Chanos chanos]